MGEAPGELWIHRQVKDHTSHVGKLRLRGGRAWLTDGILLAVSPPWHLGGKALVPILQIGPKSQGLCHRGHSSSRVGWTGSAVGCSLGQP